MEGWGGAYRIEGKMKIRLERQKLASEQDLLDRLAPVATMAGTHEPQCLVFGVLSLSVLVLAWACLLAGPDL